MKKGIVRGLCIISMFAAFCSLKLFAEQKQILIHKQGEILELPVDAAGEEGSVSIRFQPSPGKKGSVPLFIMGNPGNRLEITDELVSVQASGAKQEFRLPKREDSDARSLVLRWKSGQFEIWLDNSRISASDRLAFGKFAGQAVCGTKDQQQPLLETVIADAFLSEAEIAHQFHLLRFSNDPYMRIPKTAKAPVIDGEFSKGEWDVAAEFTGLAELSTGYLPQDSRGSFRVCYDNKNLYVAYHGPIPKRVLENLDMEALNGFVKSSKTEFDSNVESDDSVAVTIVPTYPAGLWHRLLTNHIQTHYDLTIAQDTSINLKWNPPWTSASKVGVDGWFVEMAVPLDSIQAPPVKTGTVWGMNFFRIWKQLLNRVDEWATGGRLKGQDSSFRVEFSTSRIVGQVEFGGDRAAFVKMKSLEGIQEGKPVIGLEVFNSTAETRKFDLLLASNTGDVSDRKTVELNAGASGSYSLSGNIENPNTNTLRLEVSESNGKKPVYRTELFFFQKQSLECVPRFYPSFNRLTLSLDVSKLSRISPSALSAKVSLFSRGSGALRMEKSFSGFTNHYPELILTTQKIPEGEYDAVIEVGVNGKTAETIKMPFSKLPPPFWLGNQVGISNKTPAPFTPVKVKDGTMSFWGRDYEFGSSMFPEKILVSGENILAAPIRLEAVSQTDKTPVALVSKPIEITRESETRIDWKSSGELNGLKVEVDGWAEYDGFLWFKLRIAGNPENPVKLQSISLEIPLRREWSSLLNNFDYSLNTTGLTPENGMTKGGTPTWLGNEKGGLQWLTETMGGCKLANPAKCVSVSSNSASRKITVSLLDRPDVLSSPITLNFALVATPIRPAGDWACFGGIMTSYPRKQAVYVPKTDWGNPLSLKYWGVTYGKNGEIARDVEPGYIMTSRVAFFDKEKIAPAKEMMDIARYWIYEWAASKTVRWTPQTDKIETSQASASWRDFWLWHFAAMYLKRPYTGVYYDVSRPVVCDNPYAVGDDEARANLPIHTFLGNREMAKRLYTLLRLQQPEGCISYHISGQLDGSVMGFIEMIVDGENLFSIHTRKNPHAYQRVTLPAFRAQYIGYNFGPPSQCLWQHNRVFNSMVRPLKTEEARRAKQIEIYGDPDRESRWCVGMVLAHNAIMSISYLPSQEVVILFENAWKEFGINTKTYSFLGYWEQNSVKLSPSDSNLVCSLFREKNGNRVMLVLFNNTDRNGKVEMKVDWPKLGLSPDNAEVVNRTGFGEAPTLENGRIAISITARDVRIISIVTKKIQSR